MHQMDWMFYHLTVFEPNPELGLSHFRDSIDLSQYSWIHFEGRKPTKDLVSFVEDERLRAGLKLKVSVEVEKTDRGLESLFGLADLVFVSKDFSKHSGAGSASEAVRMFKNRLRKGNNTFL